MPALIINILTFLILPFMLIGGETSLQMTFKEELLIFQNQD